MSSSEARARHRERRTHMIMLFCKNFDMSVVALNKGYQLRIEGLVDFYPTNGRYCILQSGERGDWNVGNDIRQIMLKALPDARVLNMYDKPPANRFGEPVKVYDIEKGEQPIAGIELTGVNKVTEHDVYIPPANTFYLRGARTMDVKQYNKWYRRLWRWLRRTK